MAKAKTQKKDSALDFLTRYNEVLIDPKKLVRTEDQILRTGSMKLDLMLRGGFRAGTISELYGPEGGAKTTIALSVAKRILDAGGKVLFFDLEKGLDGGVDYKDKGHLRGWMEIIGVNPEDPNLHVARPLTGEMVYEMIEASIKASLFDLIILDSMAALVPRADLEGDIGESAYGKVAKLNSEALKRVLGAYDKQEVDKTHFMIINQARDYIGTGRGGMRSPGGRALKHFVSTRLRCTRVAKKDGGINVINVRVDKNRFSPPWESVELFIHPKHAIDHTMELIEVGVKEGFIIKGGSWYTLIDPTTGEELAKVQGAEGLRAEIESRPDMKSQIELGIWDAGIENIVEIGDPEENDD